MIIIQHHQVHVSPECKGFIDSNKLEMIMLMEFSLPYYLTINSGFFNFVASREFILPEFNRERKIAFQISSFYHKRQEVPLRESTLTIQPNSLQTTSYRYDVINSNITIIIESFIDERSFIASQLKEHERSFIIDLMQVCLEFILYKYNETADGIHVIIPSVFDCSHLSFYLFYSNYLLDNALITPNVNSLIQLPDTRVFQDSLQQDVIIWKVFYNESKYALRTFDYRRSIIYAAIALESFISNTISKNILPDSYIKDSRGNNYSIFKKVNLLIRDGYLINTINGSKLDSLLEAITNPRNEIMHGKITSFRNLRSLAQDSIKALDIILKDWNR